MKERTQPLSLHKETRNETAPRPSSKATLEPEEPENQAEEEGGKKAPRKKKKGG